MYQVHKSDFYYFAEYVILLTKICGLTMRLPKMYCLHVSLGQQRWDYGDHLNGCEDFMSEIGDLLLVILIFLVTVIIR